MKILLISPTNNIYNGYGNMTHEFSKYLKSINADFKLLLPIDEKRYDYVDYPVEYVLPSYIFTLKSKRIFEYLFFDYKTDADVIHSIFEFPYALIGSRLSKKYDIPLIIGLQGTYAVKPLLNNFDKYFTLRAYKQASLLAPSSNFTKNLLRDKWNIKTEMKVIHNGVNFSRFKDIPDIGEIKERYKGKKIIITVGVIKPRKGHDVVLKALSILKKKRDDFIYLIIGPDNEVGRDEYKEGLRNIIKEGNLEKNVTFLGSVSDEDLVKYFHASYLFIHAPRLVNWNFEGFGIVYLEASACRKPIVAGDSGGIKDAVVNNETGIVVPENDPEETAKAIEKILNDEQFAKRLGENGYRYAMEHDWKNICGKFIDEYKRISGVN